MDLDAAVWNRALRASAARCALRNCVALIFFVHRRSWIATPIFYYMEGRLDQLVWRSSGRAVRRQPEARVWLVDFGGEPPTAGMTEALGDYTVQEQLETRRGRALLFVRNGRPADTR